MAITTHVSAAPTGKAVGAKGVVSAVPEQELLVAASVVAKPLPWQDDEHTVVFEDEGPLVSEAVGARFHYLAEAVDMTLDEAKAESQAEFQRQVQDSVLGVSVPFLSEVEKALLAIVERASGGTVVSGQDMEMTRQRVLFLEKDVRDIANGAIVLIRANTVSRPSSGEGEPK